MKRPFQTYFTACMLVVFQLIWISSNAQFTVGGNATSLGGGCYRLTSAQNSQRGYVFQNAAINLNQPFDYRFSVYLGSNNGGADGIVFVLRDALTTPYIGNGGGAIGYGGSNWTNSLGVEVDTWYNGGSGDIAADHIGIISQGSVSHTAASSLAGPLQASANSNNVEDGNYHTLNVRWDPNTQKLEVYLDCDYRLMHQGNLIDSVFGGDSLVHWGFVGSTGGANNLQQFCFTVPIDSFVTTLSDAEICKGDSVELDAGDAVCTYAWSPTSSLTSATANNPIAFPTTTQTYYVTVSYQCDTLYDTALVTVLQPTFTASANVTNTLCKNDCNGDIDLTVTGGNGGFGYLWSTNDVTEDIGNLCAGTYTVTITDTVASSTTYLCTITESFDVTEPVLLTVNTGNATNTSCPDGSTCDAGATAQAYGGTSPYSYLWTNNETTSQATLLCADTNWVTVTDDNGCTAEAWAFIGIPDTIVTSGFGDTLICITNVAAIIASSSGGTPPYGYIWTMNSQQGSVVSTDALATVTPPVTTTYYVRSTDGNGCEGDTSKVLVKVRPPLGVELPDLDTICPYDTNEIVAQGTGGDSLYSYAWSTGNFGPIVDVSPDLSKWFVVTVSDFCGSPPYVDSVYQQVGGYQKLRPKIEVEEDSICPGESVYLIANGQGGFGGPGEYVFKWEHTTNRNRIQFDTPTKKSTYIVTLSDLCLSEIGTDTVVIYVDNLKFPEIEVTPEEACAENEVKIDIIYPKNGYEYNWFMGDGTSRESSPVDSFLLHEYSTVGCFDIDVKVKSDFGCYGKTEYICAVKVLDQPVAAFDHNPLYPTNINPQIEFTNQSISAQKSIWTFAGLRNDSVDHFFHEFSEFNSYYIVELVAISEDGCTDTLRKQLNFVDETTIYYPSSFTPNGDGKNELFYIVGESIQNQNFELTIFNRWGQQIFLTNNPNRGWDGKTAWGERMPAGIYHFTLRYQNHLGELLVIHDDIIISKAGEHVGLR